MRIWLVAALLGIPTLAAQEPAADPPPSAARAALDALETEFRAAQDEYYRPYMEAKTDEDRAAVKLDPAKDPVPLFVPRYAALAREHSGSGEAVVAWMWIFQAGGRSPRVEEQVDAAVTALIEEYRDHVALVDHVKYAFYAGESPACRRLLESLSERSERAETRAASTYGLARLAIQGQDEAKGRKLLEEVRAKYPEVPFQGDLTYGAQVDADIFEIENLAVGKVAPEITGEDIDGKAFALSDYRGKVVMLDFWGHW
jgi:hypothetical protein